MALATSRGAEAGGQRTRVTPPSLSHSNPSLWQDLHNPPFFSTLECQSCHLGSPPTDKTDTLVTPRSSLGSCHTALWSGACRQLPSGHPGSSPRPQCLPQRAPGLPPRFVQVPTQAPPPVRDLSCPPCPKEHPGALVPLTCFSFLHSPEHWGPSAEGSDAVNRVSARKLRSPPH